MEENYLHTLDSIPLNKIVREDYRNYQIYTLMDRAIPYLQDGLKPVQRRILYTLWKYQSKGLQKVSAATGLVLTLHPHGPASIESAIVNLAQDYTFSNNYPMIDKKGYFGERMETSPAASRYIECKLGDLAKIILFEDMNQVKMTPNYDEKVMEPKALLPKLPIMLLNGAEGIGTGFSSVIPSFNHKDIIDSMIKMVETGKPKKLKPFVNNYGNKIEVDERGRILFRMKFEKIGESIYIKEIPRNFDATRLYRHLSKYIDAGFLKDFIDASVDNEVNVELIFKKGETPSLKEVEEQIGCSTSQVSNYTLINDNGIKIFEEPEEIIETFTLKRLEVVKRRYELRAINLEEKIRLNNEIIRFIKKKEYEKATKSKNRKTFVEYLGAQKYENTDYLADLAIYRMTKEEVQKRVLMIKEDKENLKKFTKIANSPRLVRKKLVEELMEVKDKIEALLKARSDEKKKVFKQIETLNKMAKDKKKKTKKKV
jgi:DNA gyrase subunit A